MPIYEYACKSCNSRFEQLVRTMSESDQKVKCPECGSVKTARALSVFAVSADAAKSSSPTPGGSCRCGGPGPCGMG